MKAHGYNELPQQTSSWIKVLIRQFGNPIFLILIACAAVAGFFGEPIQAVAIFYMIGISVVLGFFNEYRAERIVDDLKQRVSLKAVVTRDVRTHWVESPARTVAYLS